MSEELKLCPFCGGKVDFVFINHYTLASRRYDFICKDCGAQISMFAKVKCKSAEISIGEVSSLIVDQPTADVQSVVHGKWLNFIGDFSTAECSNCGEIYEVTPDEKPSEDFFKVFNECYKFCPNCGIKMNGGNNEPTA